MAAFPGATPTFTGFTAGHTLSQDSHASQHNLEQAEIIALANKLGTGASTPSANKVLIGNGAGTSSWSQVDLTTMVSGVLPQANGGTGTTSATGTGAAVYQNSPTINTPTITTPTISNFTNAQHTHGSASQGGQLDGPTAIQSSTLTNAQMVNRTRTVMFDNSADGSGGAVYTANEGGPEVGFTGTPSGYMRGRLIVPNDYVSGTDATIKVVLRATNTATHSSVHYVGSRAATTGTAWSAWNLQSNVSTGSLGFTADQMFTQSLYTISSANLAAGNFITLAYRISTAITGTIYGVAVYLEYTADM